MPTRLTVRNPKTIDTISRRLSATEADDSLTRSNEDLKNELISLRQDLYTMFRSILKEERHQLLVNLSKGCAQGGNGNHSEPARAAPDYLRSWSSSSCRTEVTRVDSMFGRSTTLQRRATAPFEDWEPIKEEEDASDDLLTISKEPLALSRVNVLPQRPMSKGARCVEVCFPKTPSMPQNYAYRAFFAQGDSSGSAGEEFQPVQPWHTSIKKVVASTRFENCVSMLVILNAAFLGVDCEMHIRGQTSMFSTVSEFLFCFVFVVEISLRLFAHRSGFFSMEGWFWNVFDLTLVCFQCLEIFLKTAVEISLNYSAPIRLLRILRIIRIARLLRTFHLIDDLRVIVSSIQHSSTALGWSLFLLAALIYIFTLVFVQVVADFRKNEHPSQQLHYYFGSIFRTFLTMFESIVGGISWDLAVQVLIDDVSPVMAIVFCVYIAACMFAMMNIVTGVFVDKAMRSVREDKDVVLATRIRDLFLTSEDCEITRDAFEAKVETPAMRDYFKQIDVDVSEAQALFELLDADGSGSIDSKEIVDGCLRLRGPAKAIELAMISRDINFIIQALTATTSRKTTHKEC